MATKKNSGPKKLKRDTQNQMFAGVCAGIGKYFDIDPTLVRLVFALLTLITGIIPGILLYVIAMFIIPNEN